MSSSRRKKKKKQANQVNIKQAAKPTPKAPEAESLKEEDPALDQGEQVAFSAEDETDVDKDAIYDSNIADQSTQEQAMDEQRGTLESDSDKDPDQEELQDEAEEETPRESLPEEQPQDPTLPDLPEKEQVENPGKSELQDLEESKKLLESMNKAKQAIQKVGRSTADFSKKAGQKAVVCAKQICEKAPVYAQKTGKILKKVKPRYWIAGGSVVVAALIALLMVGIFSWEWFGLIIHQRPVAGTWSMEQAQPATFLTLREDGSAIVSTDGLSVKGTYNLLEDDRITFHVATQEVDVWVGDFHYWATDAGLTLTRIGEGASSETEDAEQGNVLQFSKQQEDVTQVPVPETPKVDPDLIGSWSDVSENVTYTFQANGTLVIDFRGAYYNATYAAQDGQLEIITYLPGQQSEQESNEYTIADGMLSFSNMELLKNTD